jgi:hypothetical protein
MRHDPGRVGDLLRVGAVQDAVMTGECGADLVGKLVLGVLADQPETGRGGSGPTG